MLARSRGISVSDVSRIMYHAVNFSLVPECPWILVQIINRVLDCPWILAQIINRVPDCPLILVQIISWLFCLILQSQCPGFLVQFSIRVYDCPCTLVIIISEWKSSRWFLTGLRACCKNCQCFFCAGSLGKQCTATCCLKYLTFISQKLVQASTKEPVCPRTVEQAAQDWVTGVQAKGRLCLP